MTLGKPVVHAGYLGVPFPPDCKKSGFHSPSKRKSYIFSQQSYYWTGYSLEMRKQLRSKKVQLLLFIVLYTETAVFLQNTAAQNIRKGCFQNKTVFSRLTRSSNSTKHQNLQRSAVKSDYYISAARNNRIYSPNPLTPDNRSGTGTNGFRRNGNLFN